MRPYCIQGYLRVALAAPCNGNPDDSRRVLLEMENISDLPLADVTILSGRCWWTDSLEDIWFIPIN